MQEPFKTIEHTADISLEARGSNLAEAFSNLGQGMFSIITYPEKIEPNLCFDVNIKSTDTDAMAVDWLNELLFLSQANGVLFGDFKITDISDTSIKSICCAEKFNERKHPVKTEIKAATYYDLSVKKNKKVKIKVTFDV
jgi:SHS2 domain-containing protein